MRITGAFAGWINSDSPVGASSLQLEWRKMSPPVSDFIAREARFGARNYEPLGVVLSRGEGVWVEDASGKRYLDAMSGGSMALTLGHGRDDLIEAARAQAQKLAFVHNERLTNPAQERLARELTAVAPEGFERVHFVTGGSEANECALRMARSYHVERGEPNRWRVISPAQAYHGPTMATPRPFLERSAE